MPDKMTLKAAARRRERGGFVLYGRRSDSKRLYHGYPTDWFESWYPTREAALAFAARRGWEVNEEVG